MSNRTPYGLRRSLQRPHLAGIHLAEKDKSGAYTLTIRAGTLRDLNEILAAAATGETFGK